MKTTIMVINKESIIGTMARKIELTMCRSCCSFPNTRSTRATRNILKSLNCGFRVFEVTHVTCENDRTCPSPAHYRSSSLVLFSPISPLASLLSFQSHSPQIRMRTSRPAGLQGCPTTAIGTMRAQRLQNQSNSIRPSTSGGILEQGKCPSPWEWFACMHAFVYSCGYAYTQNTNGRCANKCTLSSSVKKTVNATSISVCVCVCVCARVCAYTCVCAH